MACRGVAGRGRRADGGGDGEQALSGRDRDDDALVGRRTQSPPGGEEDEHAERREADHRADTQQ